MKHGKSPGKCVCGREVQSFLSVSTNVQKVTDGAARVYRKKTHKFKCKVIVWRVARRDFICLYVDVDGIGTIIVLITNVTSSTARLVWKSTAGKFRDAAILLPQETNGW